MLDGGKGGDIVVLVVVILCVSANNDLTPKTPVCYGSRNGTKEVEYDIAGTEGQIYTRVERRMGLRGGRVRIL